MKAKLSEIVRVVSMCDLCALCKSDECPPRCPAYGLSSMEMSAAISRAITAIKKAEKEE